MTGARQPDRKTLDSVFGAELPQASSDEHGPDGERSSQDRDGWLQENVPPHHL